MDHIFNGTFYSSQPDLNWVAEGMINVLHKSESYVTNVHSVAGDGVFSQLENNEIRLVDLKSNTTRVLMSTRDVRDVSFPACQGSFVFANLHSFLAGWTSVAHIRLEIIRRYAIRAH